MNGAFYIGATGLRAQERALGVAANNITNMNTVGFKRSEIRFAEMLSVRAGDSTGLGVGRRTGLSGVAAGQPMQVFTQGELRPTGSALDLAIEGDGFIELMGPAGQSLLWRGGTLSVSSDGLLSSADGLPLKAAITIPEGVTDVRIGRDGVVSGILAGDADPTEIGRIDLQLIRDTQSLTPLGDGLYRAEGSLAAAYAPGDAGAGVFVQGALEGSNVDLSAEMVSLLMMQRAFSASAQVLQAGDQLMSIANGLRR